MTLVLILEIAAFLLFLIGTSGWAPQYPRSFIAAGLACWVLSTFVNGVFH